MSSKGRRVIEGKFRDLSHRGSKPSLGNLSKTQKETILLALIFLLGVVAIYIIGGRTSAYVGMICFILGALFMWSRK